MNTCDALPDLVPFAQFKKCENTNCGVFLLVKSEACNFTKSNTPPWVFFAFFKIIQMVPNRANHHEQLKLTNSFL